MKFSLRSLVVASGIILTILCGTTYSTPIPPTAPDIIVVDGHLRSEPNLASAMAEMFRSIPAMNERVAIMDYHQNITKAYPQAKVLVIQMRGLEWRGTDNGDTLKSLIDIAFSSGVSILIYGDTYLQGANAVGDSFFYNMFDVSCSFMDVQEKIKFLDPKYQVEPFTISSLGSDVFGKSLYKQNVNGDTAAILSEPNGTVYTSAIGSIRTTTAAKPILFYDTDEQNVAGVSLVSPAVGKRAIFLTFRLESILNPTGRASLISRLVDWLTTQTTSVDDEANSLELRASPMPASEDVQIAFTPSHSPTLLHIVNTLGTTVQTIECPAESYAMRVNTTQLTSGMYRIVRQQFGELTSIPLVIQH